MSMQAGPSRVEGLVSDLNGAIREHPLAAGLIGMGVVWMLFGGSKIPGQVPGALKSAAAKAGSAASATGTAVADGISEASSRIAGAARQVTDTASNAVSQAAASAGSISAPATMPDIEDMAAQAVGSVRATLADTATMGRKYGTAMQSKLADGLDRQPLLLGAIGLAIGAGIASTFASTRLEGQVMGAQSAAARETVEGLVADTKKRAGQVLETIKDEAQRQGLTADAAREAAMGVGDKVKGVAGAARKSMGNGLGNRKPG